MFRLSFYKDEKGNQFDYYFDFKTTGVYCIRRDILDGNSNSFFWMVIIGLSGACASFLESQFKDVPFKFEAFSLVLFIFATLFIAFGINFAYDKSFKKKEKLIYDSDRSSENSVEYLTKLYDCGATPRAAFLFLIGICLFCSVYSLYLVVITGEIMGLIIYFLLLGGVSIVVKFFSPIQIIKFKLYIRRCKKECQNK